jgi:hypothetical protein
LAIHQTVLLPILLTVHLAVLLPILPPIILPVFPAVILSILLPIGAPIFLADIGLREHDIRHDSWGRDCRHQASQHSNFQ